MDSICTVRAETEKSRNEFLSDLKSELEEQGAKVEKKGNEALEVKKLAEAASHHKLKKVVITLSEKSDGFSVEADGNCGMAGCSCVLCLIALCFGFLPGLIAFAVMAGEKSEATTELKNKAKETVERAVTRAE